MIAERVVTPLHETMVSGRRIKTLGTWLCRLLPSGESLTGLDVGCGSGELARYVHGLRPETDIVGTDVLVRDSAVIPVVAFDGARLPFEDRSFDFTMLIDVLHHTDDPEAVLRECVRVSRRYVLIKDHLCESRYDSARLRFMDWVGNRGHGVRLPYNYLGRMQWNTLCRNVGVTVEEWFPDLNLYPFPFNRIFDDTLHFMARLGVLDGS